MRSTALLTASAAARVLGVSRVTLWRMAVAGEIPTAAVTPGGQRRFARADVEAIRDGLDAPSPRPSLAA